MKKENSSSMKYENESERKWIQDIIQARDNVK